MNTSVKKRIPLHRGKLLAVQPHWNESFDNRPSFQCLLNSVPDIDDYRHVTDDKGHYRALIGDTGHYMYSDGKPTSGYGGREIKLKMLDGSIKTFIGGWSSNARTINASFGDNPLVECSITDTKKVMREGHTFYSGNILVNSILNWWLDNQHKLDWGIGLMFDSGGPWIEPTKGRFVKFSHGISDLQMLARFLPSRGYNGQLPITEKRIRGLTYFWNQWERAMKFARLGGELSGEQEAVVNA